MKGDELPPDNHFCRYMRRDKVDEFGRVTAAAYRLREGEGEFSVTWLEFVSGTAADQLAHAFVCTKRSLRIRKGDLLGIGNVGEAKTFVQDDSAGALSVSIQEDPLPPNNPAHSIICGFALEREREIADSLAEATKRVVEIPP